MPSTLFNVLFLAALIVPAAMYVAGVIILLGSLVVSQYRERVEHLHSIEAIAH